MPTVRGSPCGTCGQSPLQAELSRPPNAARESARSECPQHRPRPGAKGPRRQQNEVPRGIGGRSPEIRTSVFAAFAGDLQTPEPPFPPQATQGRCGATRASFPRRSHSRSRQRPSLLVHAYSGHGGSVAASLRVRGARAPTPSLGSAACRSGELGASITISDVSSVNGSFLSTIGNADGPAPGATWRVTFVDRHGHDHSSPRGRRSAWTVRVAGFRLPKAVMIDSRLGPDVQMVSAASTVGVRSSADIAAPARRPPGRGRACGRVGEASASRQLRLGLPGALIG